MVRDIGSLNHDIVDRILSSSPTFDTLWAANGVCRSWYQVFRTHPKAITYSVAYNIVGPALPQALDLMRRLVGSNDSEEITHLGSLERRRLAENAKTVSDLELLLSKAHRNSMSKTSQLSWNESWRFSRAIYRIMLYCTAFRAAVEGDDARVMERQQAMLNVYPTKDLFEINGALTFLRDVIQPIVAALEQDPTETERLTDICIAAGPASMLSSIVCEGAEEMMYEFMDVDIFYQDTVIFTGFFTHPLERIWSNRNVELPTSAITFLFDETPVSTDPCSQCGSVGSNLWGSANWHDLDLEARALLKGCLAQNPVETEHLDDYHPFLDPVRLITEIYDLKTVDFAGWTKEDSLCPDCLTRLISAHLHLWLFARKVQDEREPPEDCWYGYDCVTQTEVTLHCLTKNHLCAPIRQKGEPAVNGDD
ncbi:hypothetical protein C8J57DRAFT_1471175 [Mycena rebaudengoi]|nr:hypothetical protein C8J57DRAFT_1471175 [Mycena rebaudengoi]